MDFNDYVCGIPCIIRVHDWEPYRPAKVFGPAESCYEAEGGYGEWEVLNVDGEPDAELDAALEASPREFDRLEEAVFDHMENPSRRHAREDSYDPYYD